MPGANIVRHHGEFDQEARGISRYQAGLDAGKRAVSAMKEKTEKMTGRLVATAEVAVGAGAAGFIAYKYGTGAVGQKPAVELLGVPFDLLAGIGLNVAAHAGLAGKSAMHLHNVGDGFIAYYVARLMEGVATASNLPATGVPPVV